MTSQLVSAIVAKRRLISYSEHHVNTEGTSGRTASREPMDGGEEKEKEERRGEVQIPAAQLSANGRVQMAWREGAFDWGTKRHLWTTKSNSRKMHRHTYVHTHTHSCAAYCSS